MKIFRNESSASSASAKPDKVASKNSKEGKGISRVKPPTPERKNISASEIKEKLAAHVEASDASKNMAIRNNAKKLGDGFMNENAKPMIVEVQKPVLSEMAEAPEKEEKKDLLLKSDIALNDPKDTNTQEKLKSALSKGAFNFNPKEREALEKILGN